jgi:ubiquinone biosynthesis protein COQ4
MKDRISKLILRVRLIISLIRVTGNPDKTELIFDIGDRLYSLGSYDEVKHRLESDPESRRVINERKLLGKIDLDRLLTCPTGSLGHTYAIHMKSLGLDPDFFRTREIEGDVAFAVMRMRQTHDLWHVVTGFKTDVADEIGLQAFTLSYLAFPLPAILIGGALLRAAIKNAMIGSLANSIARGMTLGSQVNGLFAYDWEANWAKPLGEVRRELNLHSLTN